MTYTPEGYIYLCECPLENDYKNQLTFTSYEAQESYFNSIVKKSYSDYTYIKKDNMIKVNSTIDEIINCNYLFYKNDSISEKIYYCFITRMEYVNTNVTAIYFETDSFQTYWGSIQYNPCFIEREHVNNDRIGANIVPEGLETGDYIIQQNTEGTANLKFNMHSKMNIVIAVSNTYLDVAIPSNIRFYNGIYSGLILLTFRDFTNATRYINYIQPKASQDVIYSVFMAPRPLCEQGADFQYYGIQDGNTSFNVGFILNSNYSGLIASQTVTQPTDIDSYIPKNNKLFVFPYRYFTMTNNCGSSADYIYEYFYGSKCKFNILGSLGVGCSIKLIPTNYNTGVTNPDTNVFEANLMYGLDAGKLPISNWTNNSFQNYMKQNAVNFALDIVQDTMMIGTGLGVGALTGGIGGATMAGTGLSNVLDNLKTIYNHSLTPATVKGGVTNGDLIYSMEEGFTLYKRCIKRENAMIIDEFFSMFGYKINRVKVPNITGRENWNYVKTINCNFDGDGIPQTDMETIRKMFDNGVTFWHNPSTMYNYNNSNNIV